ncbi:MAG: hypothetical protein M5U18_05190 [Dehalococcoidia bacterium]|nr:hypothetical protein [Dehalococcoidia bacterium]
MEYESLLAHRTHTMQASAIREILKVASSPGMVSLAGGLPAAESFPLEIMEELTGAVLAKYGAQALQYDASEGFLPLREALVPHLAARGVKATADGTTIFSGSQGILDGIGKILISPAMWSPSKHRPTSAPSRPSTPTNPAMPKSKPTGMALSPSPWTACSRTSA